MKKQWIAGAALASMMALSTYASAQESDLNEQLLACFSITSEENRVVCYDEISRALAKANPEKQEIIKQRAIADFGLTHQEQSHNEMFMKAVKTERVSGFWTITMENGQVWQQNKEARFNFSSPQPEVRVFKMLLGSYALQEKGRTKKIRVTRVK